MLSTSDLCARTYVDLFQYNDGSGRQQWIVSLPRPCLHWCRTTMRDSTAQVISTRLRLADQRFLVRN